ncbi:hypothetical protein SprV_0200674200 [Sparganum proliferum]
MGSSISGYLAEAVLQELETRVFQTCKPKFWIRYVDDTFVILHRDAKDNFKRELDSVFPQIQFTMEEETDGMLSFLDVQVSRQEDGTLQTGVFRKATDTEKILHYNSNHPLSHKRSCVRTLFHRIHTHCSTEAEKLRERKTLWHLFLANGYPRSFVNKCLYRRHTKTDGEKKQKPEIFRVSPYVRNVSEATERMLRPLSVGVGHRPEATIRRLIMQPKDRLPPADTSGVIYRVKCLDCPANYCGTTDKRLRTRMHEHTLAVRRKDVRSHVTMHCLENSHTFDFDGAQVLGRAESKLAREVIEAWKSDTNSINRSQYVYMGADHGGQLRQFHHFSHSRNPCGDDRRPANYYLHANASISSNADLISACPHCDRTFTSCIGVVGHLRNDRTAKGASVPGAPTYICLYCQRWIRTFACHRGLLGYMHIQKAELIAISTLRTHTD